MSRPRGSSESSKTPHAISIKVLRLSKPAFSAQCPLPKQSPAEKNQFDRRAALSCHCSQEDENFFLSPLLNLPPSFGTVYVGETLCATVCANNEMSPRAPDAPTVSNVRLTADLQTPSRGGASPLEMESSGGAAGEEAPSLDPGATLQRVLRFGLREEGNHVLAVTVTYTETQMGEDGQSVAIGARVRTFRKLYQFVAQQLLSVRTKSRTLPSERGGHVLEAQLENLGNQALRIESVTLNPKPQFSCRSLNSWDMVIGKEDAHAAHPSLQPGNTLQVAFVLQPKEAEEETAGTDSQSKEGRLVLGQMWIQWRAAMGEQGSLNTGWLMGRRG